jgi:thymidylate synthase (FAD)
VRLEDVPFWFPDWARVDGELMGRCTALLADMEAHQRWMAEHSGLDADGKGFEEKKFRTSFMRRFAPKGVATGLVWGANMRTLRHVLEMRTDPGAEEEMRLVFAKVGQLITQECPLLFGDFDRADGAWVPRYRKV